MAKYLSNLQKNLKIGIVSYTESNTVLEVTGKVGIGTTNATTNLDVNGDIRLRGALLDKDNQAGTNGQFLISTGNGIDWITSNVSNAISGVTIRDEGSIVGTADSVSSINFVGPNITATASGSASTVTIADYVSIAGVATYAISSGISSALTHNASINTTGIITATSFSGSGDNLTALNASNISSGTLNNSRLPSNINISGIATLNQLDVNQLSPDGIDYGSTLYVPVANGSGGWSWEAVVSAGAGTGNLNGITIREEGSIVGTAESIATINFRGNNIIATGAAGGSIATITVSDTPTFDSLSVTGVSTFVGFTTFNDNVSVAGTITELYNGTFWNIVSQADIGSDPDQIPLNQYLGQLAFLDDYSPNGLRREGGSFDDVVVGVGGSVGIGTTNPTAKLDVNGTVKATLFSGSGASLTSIPNAALDNSAVSYGGVTLSLGGSDATPAFDLTDATNYPYTSLTGITTDIVGDTTPQLGGNLDLNSNNITGTGNIDITGTLNVSGVSTFQSDIHLGDTDILNFGDDNDLQIYHNGIESIIRDVGIGNLKIRAVDQINLENTTGTETYANFINNGAVQLYYDNSKKFETRTDGIAVSGIVTAISGIVTYYGDGQYLDLTNSVALGGDTTGDYVQSITGTANEVEVTGGSGEGSTPQIGLPNNVTISNDLTINRDVQINRNLNVDGNITIGGTSATLFTQTLTVADSDLILGIRTDGSGNDISNDTTATHGGIAIASTEGIPLVTLVNPGAGETLPTTYKKIMWFKSGSFTGLGTDAWLSNYAVGIGSTQFPSGTRLAAGSVQFTENDLAVVRNINASGIVTASRFVSNVSTGTAPFTISSTTVVNNLNADTVDGIEGANFLRSDTADTASGTYIFDDTSTTPKIDFAGIGNSTTFNYIIRGRNDVGSRAVHFINGSGRTADGGTDTYTIRNDGGSLRLGRSSYSTLIEGSGDLTFNANKVWHAGNDGAGSGLDADLLDGQQGSYYLNTSTTFGGDVSGTYNAIVVADDSHNHSFANLTGKISGTGDYSTNGDLVSGRGSGGVALTINDGYGNANVTFNHQNGTPEQNGKSGRIEVNTDSTSGDAIMSFELGDATSGVSTSINQILQLSSGTSNWTSSAGLTFNNIPAFNGGTSGSSSPFTVDSTQVVSNLNADLLDGLESSQFLRSDADDTTTGQIQLTKSNNTANGGGQIYLNGANGNRIDFNINGVAAPAFGTRSVGTKLVLYPSLGGSTSDYALGIENSTLWYSIPSADNLRTHRWYGGTTQLADLKGSGELVIGSTSLTGTASQKLQVSGGAYVSGNLGIGATNPGAKLDVRGGAAAGNVAAHIIAGDGGATVGLIVDGDFDINDVLFKARSNATATPTDADTKFIITGAGNVGINSTIPTSTLDVNGTLNVSGVSTFQGNVNLGDNDILNFGDGNDLQILHNGSYSLVGDFGTGNLILAGNASIDLMNPGGSEYYARFNNNGSVELYYDNSKKFETTGIGVSIIGVGNTATITGPSNLVLDPGTVGDNTGTVTILGDLQVEGTQTVINSTTMTVNDLNITLADGAANASAANGAGITVDGASATLTYASTGDKWVFNKAPYYNTDRLLTTADQGTGSGLDADTVDGLEASQFLRSDADDTGTGLITLTNGLNVTAGNVGIGTDNPGAKLDVRGDTRIYGGSLTVNDSETTFGYGHIKHWDNYHAIILRGVSSDTSGNPSQVNEMSFVEYGGIFNFYKTNATVNNNFVRFRENGNSWINTSSNVGIGTDNPGAKLDVVGTVKATDFNTTSDQNLKTNIQTIEDPLEKVLSIRGVNFEWRENHRQSAGVIAQEVEKVLPELVEGDKTKTVNYNGLIGVLVEAIKEQQKQIEELKKKVG